MLSTRRNVDLHTTGNVEMANVVKLQSPGKTDDINHVEIASIASTKDLPRSSIKTRHQNKQNAGTSQQH